MEFRLKISTYRRTYWKRYFPGFVARSKKHPEDILFDPTIWYDLWENARNKLAKEEQFSFNRWDGEDPACA